MAARTRRTTQTQKTRDKIRDSIKTGKIIKKLQESLGIGDKGEDIDPVPMTTSQQNSAKLLLDRTLPPITINEIEEKEPERTPQELETHITQLLTNMGATDEQAEAMLAVIRPTKTIEAVVTDHETDKALN